MKIVSDLKKTPLYKEHVKHNGKMIDFGGWNLPVQYTGIIEEHNAVRNRSGLFDVSHMGEVDVKGQKAFDFIQNLVTNDVAKLNVNQVMYTLMCYENGTVVDDLLIYKRADDHYLLVINASNTDKDFAWITKQAENYDVVCTNISEDVAQLALQGPLAQSVLQKICTKDLSEIKFFWADFDCAIDNRSAIVSRTGYTGEDGFEIYCDPCDAPHIFEAILKVGGDDVALCGLGCRDTLRFEAGLPLYGHEISDEITPLEASLGFFVKLDKGDFIGSDVLNAQKADGLKRKIIGLEMIDRGIARQGYEVKNIEGEVIGVVASGSMSPTFNKNLATVLLNIDYAMLDTQVYVDIRGKLCLAKIIKSPFYKRAK